MHERQLDFASSLYLGFYHKGLCLPLDQGLTTGVPSALEYTKRNAAAALEVARLQGYGCGVLAPSTLHLSWDLFGVLARDRSDIFFDSGAYPIMRWGAERAAAKGVPVRAFPHHDASSLRKLLKRSRRARPVIATDGYSPSSGRVAPLPDYLAIARESGGLLVVDDTQALGILGYSPSPDNPYGLGGGGTLRWAGLEGEPDVIIISSLAKGFGVPVAVLSGSPENVRKFETLSETMVHCSPPSNAVVAAAGRALETNRRFGDSLRSRLLRNVRLFRGILSRGGIFTSGGAFPVQTIATLRDFNASSIYSRLIGQGVRAVLHKGGRGAGPKISFIIKASHSEREIRMASAALLDAFKGMRQGLLKESRLCGRP